MVLEQVRMQLAAAADAKIAAGDARFFPDDQLGKRYGVRTPRVRAIAREAFAQVKPWPLAQRNRLCQELWRKG